MSNTIEEVPEKKRTVRKFLNQYRSLGLPNAKRFRRRTRLEEAEITIALYKNALQHAVALQGEANVILAKIAKEENWAISGSAYSPEEGEELLKIEWLGDEDVFDQAQKFLKRFNSPAIASQPR